MEAITATTKVAKRTGLSRTSLLSLYLTPPSEELTLDEFELLALDRLQLLRAIESLKTRGFEDVELNSRIYDLEKKYLLSRKDAYGRLGDEKRDQISHFILRLAYCRSEDLRRWFLTQESILFKYRLDMLSDEERQQFMYENGLQYEMVTEQEKMRLREQLEGLANATRANVLSTAFFKVPFQQALSLVANRSVFMERGQVYVPLGRLVAILTSRFRASLSRALTEASNMFEVVGADQRLAPFLKNINKQFLGSDFSNRVGLQADRLSLERVDAAAETSMPLCMKQLHFALKREHKIKHWGRLQYGLFLKGAGLDLDSALAFFEGHFTKVMTHEQFTKSYSYTFRHMYGKEGARKNYTPYSCTKIIMGNAPEPGASHGCPFKHSSDGQLANLLSGMKIGTMEVKEITDLAKNGNYQLACQRHFEVTHPGNAQTEIVANHPNQWFQASVRYFKAKNNPNPDAASEEEQKTAAETETQSMDI